MSEPTIPEDRVEASRGQTLWLAAMPGVFVLLWSTGFIGAKMGLPHAEPMTYLALRFGLAGLLLLAVTLIARAPWPKTWAETGHIAVAGLLLQFGYLGGVFVAISLGLEAGVAALIVGLQPLLVAAAAGLFLGERLGPRQWLGMALGFGGVTLVVWRKLEQGIGSWEGVGFCLAALVAIAASTLYQKRYCSHMPLRAGNVIQFAAAAVACGLCALAFETMEVRWTGEFVFALTWLILVLSLGAFTLLYILIRRGAASKVASLFFLVPPATALVAWALFGERMGPLALLGMAVAVTGVALVNLKGARQGGAQKS